MGLLTIVASPLERLFANSSTLTVVAASIASFLVLSVVVNVLNQILFRNPHEPPVVFHLFPVIGSTIQYGMDPYKFFFEQREKVC
jgi:sterol 14-demethylase